MHPITRKIYRLKDVCAVYGLSRSTIYRLIERGLFPKPIKIGLSAVGWDADDLSTWYCERKFELI
ncbi:helix-turn-helix transcriptional regulator [Roseateles koreensis]|uniref:helix-turn-helix transcriptional regulator n=1 Tax=Roseateles koreensis TaxID=2987526 RepID=UPI0039648625